MDIPLSTELRSRFKSHSQYQLQPIWDNILLQEGYIIVTDLIQLSGYLYNIISPFPLFNTKVEICLYAPFRIALQNVAIS